MALVSKHFEILTAVRAAIIADTDLAAAIPAVRWIRQKRPWFRTQPWLAGGRICPLRRQNPPHENRLLRVIYPVLVSLAWPKDQALADGLEAESAVIERIEQIFALKGGATMPAPLALLGSTYVNTVNAYEVEQTVVQPGDPFVESAFHAGFDAVACVIEVYVLAPKTDESTLGVVP